MKEEKSIDFQIELIGKDKKVLGIGSPLDNISKRLKENNCHVTTIEMNPIVAKKTEKFVDKIIVEDVETLNFNEILGSEKYDIILMSNFLECLRKPTEILKTLHKFLAQNGYIVCSITNIAHASVRLKLLNGEFTYNTALFDEDHIHFFTLDTILSMLDESKFFIDSLHRIKDDIKTNIDLKYYTLPKELIESILRDQEATTIQYVFSAAPTFDNNTETRKWLMGFPKNITTDRLEELFHFYRTENFVKTLTKQIEQKDAHILNIISDYKKLDEEHNRLNEEHNRLYQAYKDLENEHNRLNEDIHNSFIWKMLRKYDNSIGKIISSKKKKEHHLKERVHHYDEK